jgi:hypothetical protein
LNCVDVVRALIVGNRLYSCSFRLIEHAVGINWRVENISHRSRIANIKEGLVQHRPIQEVCVSAKDILSDGFVPSLLLKDHANVMSISSRVKGCGRTFHLAMMNLHPEVGVGYYDVLRIVRAVTEDKPGFILRSGRYYHYYGSTLLTPKQWHEFMAQFLMPTIIVSPRYIGHCLYRGYAALRITTNSEYKPHCPDLCDKI